MSPPPSATPGLDPVRQAAASMVEVPGGAIVLRDEGTGTTWDVTVDPVLVGAVPVTRSLYAAVIGTAPPGTDGPQVPVTEVSWAEAVRFCNALSDRSGLGRCYDVVDGGDDPDGLAVVCDWTAGGYRLPSEAEWEHACRAGTTGVRPGELDDIAWWRENSGGRAHDVATKEPNGWGLFDTIGNVWEWCWDVYDPRVYGPYRVFRGGGWSDVARGCRASCRRKSHPTLRIDDLGFRLARRT